MEIFSKEFDGVGGEYALKGGSVFEERGLLKGRRLFLKGGSVSEEVLSEIGLLKVGSEFKETGLFKGGREFIAGSFLTVKGGSFTSGGEPEATTLPLAVGLSGFKRESLYLGSFNNSEKVLPPTLIKRPVFGDTTSDIFNLFYFFKLSKKIKN